MVSSDNQAKAPISSHPAFPAIVALWFAALLGIGSLIVPAAVFEQMFAISGLAEIVPAARAPLGLSAQLWIAFAGTAIGALAGLLLARKVAGGSLRQSPSTGSEDDFPWAKSPISALAELGAPILDHPVEDERPVEPAAEEWAGELNDHVEQLEEFNRFETPQQTSGGAEIALPEAEPEVDLAPRSVRQNPTAGMTAEQLISRPLDELGIVQLVERFALSLQRQPASALHAQKTAFSAAEPVDEAQEDEEFSSLLSLRKTSAGPRKSVALPEDGGSDPSETVAIFPRPESDPVRPKFAAPVSVPDPDRPASGKGTVADTERTLRGALEQLQKMSGVG